MRNKKRNAARNYDTCAPSRAMTKKAVPGSSSRFAHFSKKAKQLVIIVHKQNAESSSFVIWSEILNPQCHYCILKLEEVFKT